jgi:hypothetical protein
MTFLIMEKEFDPPLSAEAHDAEARRLDPCLDAHGVRWIRSYISTDRRRMICEFEAADAEAVRNSFRSAGVAFVRVWAAEPYFPGGGPHGGWREREAARQEEPPAAKVRGC